ncbi:multidrug efflux system outer membrane protein [Natronospira proteinivora]|uniref:Multidrug efflux system outer membrane protein n=1 Tax=Natronospira proteinivora TaxID=1807133 RepID=A0ABT1G6H2_9GAMM|nr:efflux transporter outer membrane subunit [Natronospira proteinivora]MCP1726900.1 multidrug efflux system outer membrane protein [Natronospira proteinivora]
MGRAHRHIFVLALLVLLGACSLSPEYQRPDLLLPEEWPTDESELDREQGPDVLTDWWTRFDDPQLNELVEHALEENPDLEMAAARVAEARAVLGMGRAERLPRLDLEAELERENPGESGDWETDLEIAAALSYEVDLWGRLAQASESARAQLLSTAYTRDAIRLTIISDVISHYFQLRAAQDQIRITRDTIQTREEALELEQIRRRAGAATQLALRQAEAELETSRAELPGRLAEARQLSRALAILVGRDDEVMSGLEAMDDNQGLPDLNGDLAQLPAYIPARLLEYRPDIQAAEYALIATNADIGVARANWFPRINLVAALGTAASSGSSLFTSAAQLESLTGEITAPILDFGRRAADVETAEARKELAEIQYRSTILEAFQEVADAWTLMTTAEEQRRVREREVDARLEVTDLAVTRYVGGYTEYLEVLDARRALFDAQIALTEAERDRLVAEANLYRALGGSWAEEIPTPD